MALHQQLMKRKSRHFGWKNLNGFTGFLTVTFLHPDLPPQIRPFIGAVDTSSGLQCVGALPEQLQRKIAGFTLLEVALAILILASALVILIGMQSSAIDQAFRDKYSQQSMLLARELLSVIESTEDVINVGEKEAVADKILQEEPFSILGDKRERDADYDSALKNLMVRLSVSYWGVPGLDDHAMKKITLGIWPIEMPDEVFQVVYFIPNDEDKDDSNDGGQ